MTRLEATNHPRPATSRDIGGMLMSAADVDLGNNCITIADSDAVEPPKLEPVTPVQPRLSPDVLKALGYAAGLEPMARPDSAQDWEPLPSEDDTQRTHFEGGLLVDLDAPTQPGDSEDTQPHFSDEDLELFRTDTISDEVVQTVQPDPAPTPLSQNRFKQWLSGLLARLR